MVPLIKYINKVVDEKYRLWYDKSELKRMMKGCPDWKLLD
jgi:hypothetical protein